MLPISLFCHFKPCLINPFFLTTFRAHGVSLACPCFIKVSCLHRWQDGHLPLICFCFQPPRRFEVRPRAQKLTSRSIISTQMFMHCLRNFPRNSVYLASLRPFIAPINQAVNRFKRSSASDFQAFLTTDQFVF